MTELRHVDDQTTAPSPHTLVQAAGWPFLLTAFVARMPSSMVQLGYLMILAKDGRGLAVGGMAVAAVGLGSAIGGPLMGRLVDRFGPLRVITLATLVSLAAQGAFLVGLTHQASSLVLLAWAGLVGAANPQVGPVARSHWSNLANRLRDSSLVSRALGYEGAVDEIGFVVGPTVASLLVSMLGASTAALVIMGLTFVLQGVFIIHLARDRAGWTMLREGANRVVASERLTSAVIWPMLACLGVGVLFGSSQTALTAMFSERGQQALTGLVYGCVGIGSGTASLMSSRVLARFSISRRVALGAMCMGLGTAALLTLPGIPLAVVGSLLLGTGAGITVFSSFGRMEQIAPRHRMATMMTVLATCITLGVSGGATAAGQLADHPADAFLPLLAAATMTLLAAPNMSRLRRSSSPWAA